MRTQQEEMFRKYLIQSCITNNLLTIDHFTPTSEHPLTSNLQSNIGQYIEVVLNNCETIFYFVLSVYCLDNMLFLLVMLLLN